jgi:hypothetical protein
LFDVGTQKVHLFLLLGWIVHIFNYLFYHSITIGKVDYFFESLDDVEFISKDWLSHFISKLKDNPILSNFGAVGPLDITNKRLLISTLVSKVHFQIFGTLYPSLFRNCYSDDWLTYICLFYFNFLDQNFNSKFHEKNFTIQHQINTYGTR